MSYRTEIAKNDLLHWWIRKFYQLPPTDERYLNLTEEQIYLEFEHYLLENPKLRSSESYYDPAYEEWEKQVTAEDSKINTDD